MSQRVRNIILGLITDAEMDVAGIAAAGNMARQTAGAEIRNMLAEGMIHVTRREGFQQRAYYRAGAGENAPHRISARQHIVKMLTGGEYSAMHMADAIGISRQSTQTLISQLKEEGVKIRIAGWRGRTKGPRVAVYTIGEGQDAERPDAMTNAEKVAKYRATPKGKATYRRCAKRWRKSAAGKEYARKGWQARSARAKFEKRGVAAIDPLLAAIMGM